ncbi:MAG: Gfo/Idh/MocA family oxidoreductase [Chloroflexi bacterium]|nr:Gfo/Idh/MocA family oxidoreductase [Chloroflexota bacterium]
MKVGMVGLDTSHCVAFAKLLSGSGSDYSIPGVDLVAAYPGGSELFSLSRDRVKGYTDELRTTYGVTICDSIEDVVTDVDAVLLESVDGRQHLEQFRKLAVGKPVYIDKPITVTTAETRELMRLAESTGTPVMSCSSLRFAAGITDLVHEGELVVSCEAFGPAAVLPDYPGLFWYGIHSAEMLFALMGTGCRSVQGLPYDTCDVLVSEWSDGRIGVMRGTRFGENAFGCVVHSTGGVRVGLAADTPPFYYLLLKEIVRFFETGISPVKLEETYEIIAFLQAADQSKSHGGAIAYLDPL